MPDRDAPTAPCALTDGVHDDPCTCPDIEIGPAADIRDFTRRHGLLPAPELP